MHNLRTTVGRKFTALIISVAFIASDIAWAAPTAGSPSTLSPYTSFSSNPVASRFFEDSNSLLACLKISKYLLGDPANRTPAIGLHRLESVMRAEVKDCKDRILLSKVQILDNGIVKIPCIGKDVYVATRANSAIGSVSGQELNDISSEYRMVVVETVVPDIDIDNDLATVAKQIRDIGEEQLDEALVRIETYLRAKKNELKKHGVDLERYVTIREFIDGLAADRGRKRSDTRFARLIRNEKVDIVDDHDAIINIAMERGIVHVFGLRHRTANAFVLAPDGRVLLQRRVHNKAEALTLSIFGGHLASGQTYAGGIRRELLEELGLDEIEAELQGTLTQIGADGQFANNVPDNNEYRSLYCYRLTQEEYAAVVKQQEYINAQRKTRTREEFKAWIEAEQAKKSGYGEVWGYHFGLVSDIDPNGIDVAEEYTDGVSIEKVGLSSDLLAPLVKNEAEQRPGILPADTMALVKKASAASVGLAHSDRKTIVHVSYQDPDHLAGGQGVAVLNLCKAQIRLGYETVWISPCVRDEVPGEYSYLDGRLKVIKVKASDERVPTFFGSDEKTQSYRVAFSDKFVELIRTRFNPADCHVNIHGFIEEPRRAAELAGSGFNVTSSFHMFLSPRAEETGEQNPFIVRLRELERDSIMANTKIIVNSNAMRDELLRLCPGYKGSLYVMPNFTESENFETPRLVERDKIPLVTTHGRISPEKGYDIFIEAAKIITERRKAAGRGPVNFLVFGKTDDSMQIRRAYKEKMEKMAQGYPNITLELSGPGIWGAERLRRMDRTHVGVVSSRYEPFGLTLVEYMARGIPSISTLTHGAKDILGTSKAGKTPYGIVVNTDAHALADAIEALVDNPEEAKKLALGGREKAIEDYREDAVIRRYVNIYRAGVFDNFDLAPFTAEEKLKGLDVLGDIASMDAERYRKSLRPLFRGPKDADKAKTVADLAASGELFAIFPSIRRLAEHEMPGHPMPWEFFDALDRIIRLDRDGYLEKRTATFAGSGSMNTLPYIDIASNAQLRAVVERFFKESTDEEKEILLLLPLIVDIARCVKPQAHPEIAARFFIKPLLEKLGFGAQAVEFGTRIVLKHVDLGTLMTTESSPAKLLSGWNPSRLDMDALTILSIADRSYGKRASELETAGVDDFLAWGDLSSAKWADLRKNNNWTARRIAKYLHISRDEAAALMAAHPARADLEALNAIEFLDYGDATLGYIASGVSGKKDLPDIFAVLSRIAYTAPVGIKRIGLLKAPEKIAAFARVAARADLQMTAEQLTGYFRGFGITFEATAANVLNVIVDESRADAEYMRMRRTEYEKKWDGLVNWPLDTRIAQDGFDAVEKTTDFSKEKGILWFPHSMKYKVLDAPGGAREVQGHTSPKDSAYSVQYNLSRGAPRGDSTDKAQAKTDCPFCKMTGSGNSDFLLGDLEKDFRLPYALYADSRPFFNRHMLALEKQHTGTLTHQGMKDLLIIFNKLFPGKRGNIGTGNAASHLHIHIYETEFPIETQKKDWILDSGGVRVGIFKSDAGTVGFVVESADIGKLADAAYAIFHDIDTTKGADGQKWEPIIITAPNQVYLIPQRSKTMKDKAAYPPILEAFCKNKAPDVRLRNVGPVEAAGIWLCYSRGNIRAMEEMYGAMDLAVYKRIISETGVHSDDAAFRAMVAKIKGQNQAKNLSYGTIDEAKETHPALEAAANDGRLFAMDLRAADSLPLLDNETIAKLVMAQLHGLKDPDSVRAKLLRTLSDEEVRARLVKGFALMKEAVKTVDVTLNGPLRLCIVIEDNGPAIVYKDIYNSLIAHAGRGEKTRSPGASLYIGYSLLKFAGDKGHEKGFKEVVIHEMLDLVAGSHAEAHAEEARLMYDRFLASLPEKIITDRSVPFVELHLTNLCNQECKWCSYKGVAHAGTAGADHLLFADLDRIAALHPQEILIVGGGEPTLYRDGDKTFNDAIMRLRQLLPSTKLRLITNGTVIPAGDWIREIAEVSVSLDSPDRKSYRAEKERDFFDRVYANILWYLEKSPIQSVRVTTIYDRERLDSSIKLARRLHVSIEDLARRGALPETKRSLFRYMIFPKADDKDNANPYAQTRLSAAMKKEWSARMAQEKEQDAAFWDFITFHTNINVQPLKELRVGGAQKCYGAAKYVLVGADRKYYPCFATCEAHRDIDLGSIDQGTGALLENRRRLLKNPPPICKDGCRPVTTFYGLRAFRAFSDQFRDIAIRQWEGSVNKALADKVDRLGIEQVEQSLDISAEPGIIWFPNRIRYKVLDAPGRQQETIGTPVPPKQGFYLVQYNESRGTARRLPDGCAFCNRKEEFKVADMQEYFGLNYTLVEDDRPFFDKHMLIIAKKHQGAMNYQAFHDYLWMLNNIFPGMRSNIATGTMLEHSHNHLYDIEFPIERMPRTYLVDNPQYKIGMLDHDLGLAYFVVESDDVDMLAEKAYWLAKEIESRNMLTAIVCAPKRVFIIPQVKKTIGDDYPDIFNPFKEKVPDGTRVRYIGPVEAAGIFLCYSRPDVGAMKKMYESLTLDIYKKILLETGLNREDARAKAIVSLINSLWDNTDEMVSFYDVRAKNPDLCGGKGSNFSYLTDLAELTKIPGRLKGDQPRQDQVLNIPEGYILTTKAFDSIVLRSKKVRALINKVEKLSKQLETAPKRKQGQIDKELMQLSADLKTAVREVRIPEGVRKKILDVFKLLGGNVAVRSSATLEDSKGLSCAGQAKTYLNNTTEKAVIDSVLNVWASTYDYDFIVYRNANKAPHDNAKMAVVFQKMVDAKSAGVALTLDEQSKRSGFRITGNFGLGESVVGGGNLTDSWFVSPDAQYILEKKLGAKESQVVFDEKGGTKTVRVSSAEYSMTDEEVLNLTQLLKAIRDYYRELGVRHVDIEYAIEKGSNTIYITQTRPVTSTGSVKTIQVETARQGYKMNIDRHTFLRGVAGNPGVTTGRLQVIEDSEGYNAVREGAILVCPSTTNRWNASMEKVRGIITDTGSFHAMQTSIDLNMPSLIGAENAVETLRKYNDMTVTFDARLKTVFIGKVEPETVEINVPVEVADMIIVRTASHKYRKDRERVELHEGLIANKGAVTGKLQIVYDTEGYGQVKDGVILLTHSTTNRWNDAFRKIKGVITDKGDMNCHAAIASREPWCNCPSLVGAKDAIEKLKEYDGKVVTFDSRLRTVFAGEVPIEELRLDAAIWKENPTFIRDPFEGTLWDRLKGMKNALEDFDGNWFGRPRIPYGYFQLDYYEKAFVLCDRIGTLFAWPAGSFRDGRAPSQNVRLRKIKDRSIFVNIVKEPMEPTKSFMCDLTLDGFEYFLKQRLAFVKELETYGAELASLDATNVEKAVDMLPKTLFWPTMAFALDDAFNFNYLNPQVRFISDEKGPGGSYVEMAKELAFRRIFRGRDRNIMTEKRKELVALAQMINARPAALAFFARDDMAGFRTAAPDLYERIEALSLKYKAKTEDIRLLSDTAEHVKLIAEHVKKLVDLKDLLAFCDRYLTSYGSREKLTAPKLLSLIRRRDKDLAFLIHAYAAENRITDAGAVRRIMKEKEKLELRENTALDALKTYPYLEKVLAMGKQIEVMRNDMHDIVVAYQRRMAKAMIETARQHPEIFETPEQVFDISTEELIAVVKERDPSYVKKAFTRNAMIEKAEKDLEAMWKASKSVAASVYADEIETVKKLIYEQKRAATIGRVKDYYSTMARTLDERVAYIKKRVLADTAEAGAKADDILATAMVDYHNNDTATAIALTKKLLEVLAAQGLEWAKDAPMPDRDSTATGIAGTIAGVMACARKESGGAMPKEAGAVMAAAEKRLENIVADSIVGSAIVLCRKAKRQQEGPLVISLDLSWIPEHLRRQDGLKKLLAEIDRLPAVLRSMGLDNVVMISKAQDETAGAWLERVRGVLPDKDNMSNVVMMGSPTVIGELQDDAISSMTAEARPVLAAIDSKMLAAYQERDLYVQVMEMLSLSLEFCMGKLPGSGNFTVDYCALDVIYDHAKRSIVFLPRAEKVNIDGAPELYRAKIAALQAA